MTRSSAVDVSRHVSVNRVTALTAELVGFDIQNPPGREVNVVPALEALLRSLGCDVEQFRSPSGRPSVLAGYACAIENGPTLLINGHLDVVPVNEADWSHPPFAAEIRDDRVIGRGATDMKGGIAAAIEGCAPASTRVSVLPQTLTFAWSQTRKPAVRTAPRLCSGPAG